MKNSGRQSGGLRGWEGSPTGGSMCQKPNLPIEDIDEHPRKDYFDPVFRLR